LGRVNDDDGLVEDGDICYVAWEFCCDERGNGRNDEIYRIFHSIRRILSMVVL
jgi:hypothetical protein